VNKRQIAWTATGVAAALAAAAWRRRQSLDFAGKSVVIIGGSRGLGLVMARELAAEGARVTLVARNVDELDRARADLEARGGTARTAVCDIRDRAQVEKTIRGIAAASGGIDVLINDAGVIQVGPFEHMDVADFEDALATHFYGPLYAVLAALPHLKQSAAPRIVNISSIGGKIAVPHLLPYSASKFALAGLSQGLRSELARYGIRVTSVYPGLMRTGSTYNAWFRGNHRSEFAWFHHADAAPVLSMSARRAARQIIEACRRGDAELVVGLPAKLAVLANTCCPGTTASLMALTNRLLPGARRDGSGAQSRSGWQSVSWFAPSLLSRSADRATVENNETPA
jgi:NAD(P)-dependent dehydrogenase (short-subunit alcohol dehydrogenase family)